MELTAKIAREPRGHSCVIKEKDGWIVEFPLQERKKGEISYTILNTSISRGSLQKEEMPAKLIAWESYSLKTKTISLWGTRLLGLLLCKKRTYFNLLKGHPSPVSAVFLEKSITYCSSAHAKVDENLGPYISPKTYYYAAITFIMYNGFSRKDLLWGKKCQEGVLVHFFHSNGLPHYTFISRA